MFTVSLTMEQSAVLHVHAHSEYLKNLRMAGLFIAASKAEDAPHLANLARSFSHEAAQWHDIGLQVERLNGDLETADWRPQGTLQDFLDAMHSLGFTLDEVGQAPVGVPVHRGQLAEDGAMDGRTGAQEAS